MKKSIQYELITVKKWVRRGNEIVLLTEDGREIKYLGTYSFSQLWLKAKKGKKICVGLVEAAGKIGCILIGDKI